jgi:hypothetical protein
MRALANRPFTLTELDSLIPDLSYPDPRAPPLLDAGDIPIALFTDR